MKEYIISSICFAIGIFIGIYIYRSLKNYCKSLVETGARAQRNFDKYSNILNQAGNKNVLVDLGYNPMYSIREQYKVYNTTGIDESYNIWYWDSYNQRMSKVNIKDIYGVFTPDESVKENNNLLEEKTDNNYDVSVNIDIVPETITTPNKLGRPKTKLL